MKFLLFDLIINTIKLLANFMLSPTVILAMVILTIFYYFQNLKITSMQKMIIGKQVNSPMELTISQIVLGILAGILLSIGATITGIVFTNAITIVLFLATSFLFMYFQNKNTGVALSGAILAFANIILYIFVTTMRLHSLQIASYVIVMPAAEVLKNDIIAIITLTGLIHIAEGLLIATDGSRGSIPVFTNKNDAIVGGYAFKRTWMLPVVVFLLLSRSAAEGTTNVIAAPDWWPLSAVVIPSALAATAIFSMVPLFSMFSYSAVTFTKSQKEKVTITGAYYILYGLLVAALAQLASTSAYLELAVVAIMVAAMFSMVKAEEYFEAVNAAKYKSDEEGIMILAVADQSPAHLVGLRAGDKLLQINSEKLQTDKDIYTLLEEEASLSITIKRKNGKLIDLIYENNDKSKHFGIVFVPRAIPEGSTVVRMDSTSKVKQFMDKFKKDK